MNNGSGNNETFYLDLVFVPSQSVLLSVSEQTNLKSFLNVNSLDLDSRSFVLWDFPIHLF